MTSCTVIGDIEVRDSPRASELNAQLGLEYLKQGKYELALSKLDKSIKFDDNNADAYHYKAEIYNRIGEFEKADENYMQAVDLAPNDASIHNNFGAFLCDQGRYQEAYSHFNKTINNPLFISKDITYENIGLCALQQNNLKRAEEAFTLSIQINPNRAKSLIKLAQIYYDKNNRKEAYELLTRYIKVAQHSPESLWLGILLERGKGHKNTVATYANLLKGKFPDSKEAELLQKLEQQGSF